MLAQVPVDAQGNITQAFIQSMLTPTNAVNTTLFDNSHASGLSAFARIGIRMMGHDLYDGGLDGDVAIRTLLAPNQSGNVPFTVTPANIDIVKEWGRRDLQDDGSINGSVYAKLIEDVWPVTDHVSIPGFANQLTFKNANLNAAEMFRAVPAPNTAEGISEIAAKAGVSSTELLGFSLWGHLILDQAFTGQQIASEALTNQNTIDFQLANVNQANRTFTQNLTTDPNADSTLGLGVLNLLMKVFR